MKSMHHFCYQEKVTQLWKKALLCCHEHLFFASSLCILHLLLPENVEVLSVSLIGYSLLSFLPVLQKNGRLHFPSCFKSLFTLSMIVLPVTLDRTNRVWIVNGWMIALHWILLSWRVSILHHSLHAAAGKYYPEPQHKCSLLCWWHSRIYPWNQMKQSHLPNFRHVLRTLRPCAPNDRRAFCYQTSLLWNQLPVWVQETDTTSTFKTKLKTFLFSKADN